jgi:excisionase family DNA binding protein
MKAGALRDRVLGDLAAALRSGDAERIATAADRAKAVGVALAGLADDAGVRPGELWLPTRSVATVLGYHPEHVRRLIRSGRLAAERASGDYRVRIDDLTALVDARRRSPRSRAATRRAAPDEGAMPDGEPPS